VAPEVADSDPDIADDEAAADEFVTVKAPALLLFGIKVYDELPVIVEAAL
jgi:hypothetical protein